MLQLTATAVAAATQPGSNDEVTINVVKFNYCSMTITKTKQKLATMHECIFNACNPWTLQRCDYSHMRVHMYLYVCV